MARKNYNTIIYITIGAAVLYHFYKMKKAKEAAEGGGSSLTTPAAAAARTIQAVENSTFKPLDNSFKSQYQKDISKCVM